MTVTSNKKVVENYNHSTSKGVLTDLSRLKSDKDPTSLRTSSRLSKGLGIGHVSIEVLDLDKARDFYDRFLPVLGFRKIQPVTSAWLGYRKEKTTLWFTVSKRQRVKRDLPHVPADGADDPISDHIGFCADSSEQVEALETILRRNGLVPIYSTGKEKLSSRSFYTSNAWNDPDNNVLEIYALTSR